MSKFDCAVISRFLSAHHTEIGASELHGRLTGYLCVNANSGVDARLRLYEDWLEVRVGSSDVDVLETLYIDTLESLDEFSDFEFRILAPADEAPIAQRSLALSRWCSGFLSGFGSTGRYHEGGIGEEVSEALNDFSKIAGLAEEVPDSEENEVDLMEISEFVRISVLLIFTECGGSRPAH